VGQAYLTPAGLTKHRFVLNIESGGGTPGDREYQCHLLYSYDQTERKRVFGRRRGPCPWRHLLRPSCASLPLNKKARNSMMRGFYKIEDSLIWPAGASRSDCLRRVRGRGRASVLASDYLILLLVAMIFLAARRALSYSWRSSIVNECAWAIATMLRNSRSA